MGGNESFFAYFPENSHCTNGYAKLGESFFAFFLFERKKVKGKSSAKNFNMRGNSISQRTSI